MNPLSTGTPMTSTTSPARTSTTTGPTSTNAPNAAPTQAPTDRQNPEAVNQEPTSNAIQAHLGLSVSKMDPETRKAGLKDFYAQFTKMDDGLTFKRNGTNDVLHTEQVVLEALTQYPLSQDPKEGPVEALELAPTSTEVNQMLLTQLIESSKIPSRSKEDTPAGTLKNLIEFTNAARNNTMDTD